VFTPNFVDSCGPILRAEREHGHVSAIRAYRVR
jgi:hypothetical protein